MAFWLQLGWEYNGDTIFSQTSWANSHSGTLTVPVITGGNVSIPAQAQEITECGPGENGEWVCQSLWELSSGPRFRLAGDGSHYEGLGTAMEPIEYTMSSSRGNFFDSNGNNISPTEELLGAGGSTFSEESDVVAYPYVTAQFDQVSGSEWRMQLDVAWYSQQGRSRQSDVYPIVDVITQPASGSGVLSGEPLAGIWLDRTGEQNDWVDNSEIGARIRWIIVYVA